MILAGLGLRSTLQTVDIVLLLIIIIISLPCYILSKVLNAHGQPLTSQQMVSLWLEQQKRPEECN